MDGWMDRWMDGWMYGCMDVCNVILRANPPLAYTQLLEGFQYIEERYWRHVEGNLKHVSTEGFQYIEERYWRHVEGNLKHVSTEFLGNHDMPTLVKLYIQGNLQHVSGEFLANHSSPPRLNSIFKESSRGFNRVSRESLNSHPL